MEPPIYNIEKYEHVITFVVQNRTQSSIRVHLQEKEETYDLLHILDFNNDRKRMSVSSQRTCTCVYC
jgi:hypothetical protein